MEVDAAAAADVPVKPRPPRSVVEQVMLDESPPTRTPRARRRRNARPDKRARSAAEVGGVSSTVPASRHLNVAVHAALTSLADVRAGDEGGEAVAVDALLAALEGGGDDDGAEGGVAIATPPPLVPSIPPAIRAAPSSPPAWAAWGRRAWRSGDALTAVARFRAGAALAARAGLGVHPATAALLTEWAGVEARRARAGRARALFKAALDACGGDAGSGDGCPSPSVAARARLGLAALEARAGNGAEAVRVYATALRVAPTDTRLLAGAAALRAAQGRPASASRLLARARALNPASPRLAAAAGGLAEAAGELEGARGTYLSGLVAGADRDPVGLGRCAEGVARLAERAGDAASARAALAGCAARLPRTGPSSARLLREWAALEKRGGNLDAAARLYARAAAAGPGPASSADRTLLAWALLERRAGRLDGARALFAAASRAAPYNPCITVAWARAEKAAGALDAARAVLAAGVRRSPGTRGGAVLREWACLEAEAGDPAAARAQFARGVASGDALLMAAWADFEEGRGEAELAAGLRAKAAEAAGAVGRRRK